MPVARLMWVVQLIRELTQRHGYEQHHDGSLRGYLHWVEHIVVLSPLHRRFSQAVPRNEPSSVYDLMLTGDDLDGRVCLVHSQAGEQIPMKLLASNQRKSPNSNSQTAGDNAYHKSTTTVPTTDYTAIPTVPPVAATSTVSAPQ